MKKIERFFLCIIAIVIVFVSLPVWACDALGPNRHVGVVTKIDPIRGTFTIIDAQARRPMIFMAKKEILEALKLSGNFIVTFRKNGEDMEAEAVVPGS